MFEKYEKLAEIMNKKVTNPQYYFYFMKDFENFICIPVIPKQYYDNNGYVRDWQNLEDDKDENGELVDDIYDDEFLSLVENIKMDEECDWTYSCHNTVLDEVFNKLMETNLCIYKEIKWNEE